MKIDGPSFTFAVTLGAGVAAQLAARHLRVPSIVVLLLAGVALGPDGLGWISPRSLGEGLFALVTLGVAVILFEGGLGLTRARLRAAALPVRRLISFGALITFVGASLAASLLLGWPAELAILFGSLVIVTGPTVVRPLLRAVPVTPRLAAVLEAEGLLIDSVGAIVAAVTLQIVVAPSVDTFASGAFGLVARFAFGTAAGAAIGLALSEVVRRRALVPEGLENLVTLGGALTGFALCEVILPDSGILAVTLAGVVVGNRASEVSRKLSDFQEHLTVALIGMLFVLLAADVRLADLVDLGVPGLVTVAVLAFVLRPLVVLACTASSDLERREKLYLAWLAPRGVVAAAVASLAAAVLGDAGIPGGDQVRALVFLTIAATVGVLGGAAPLVARLLGVRRAREGVVILGADELALALGEALRSGGERVTFADVNADHCLAAERAGFPVVFGDASSDSVLARMQLETVRAAIGLTTRSELNHLFAAHARDEFGVRELYVAAPRSRGAVEERLAERVDALVLFDRPKELERWNVQIRHRGVTRRSARFAGAPDRPAAPDAGLEASLVLAVTRGGRCEPMHSRWQGREGDVAQVLVQTGSEQAAAAELGAIGWELLPGDPGVAPAGP